MIYSTLKIRDFYLPKFQDIVLLKFWISWSFPNFRKISLYINVNFICLCYTWCQNVLSQNSASSFLAQQAATSLRAVAGSNDPWRWGLAPEESGAGPTQAFIGQGFHQAHWIKLKGGPSPFLVGHPPLHKGYIKYRGMFGSGSRSCNVHLASQYHVCLTLSHIVHFCITGINPEAI